MKNCITSLIMVCALAIMASTVFAQKTQVGVQGDKVKARTQGGTATVQKGILKKSASPVIGIDNPMVDDLIQMDKWVEEEKTTNKMPIYGTAIIAYNLGTKDLWTAAAMIEVPASEADLDANTLRMNMSILKNPKFYDIKRNPVPFELQQLNPQPDPNFLQGQYYLHFQTPPPEGKGYKFICTTEYVPEKGVFWKEGALWNMRANSSGSNCLAYYKVILPKSAIFVNCNRPLTNIESVDGRVAVTIRSYSGPAADCEFRMSFLWPEMDGTSLADLPPQYRGLEKSAE